MRQLSPRLAVTLRPLPTSSSPLWWLCQRCPTDKAPYVKSRWVPCPASPLSASLPLPALCAAAFSLTVLSVFGFVLLLQPVWLSVCLSILWLTAPSGLYYLFGLLCFAWFFKPAVQIRSIWCHLLFSEWITLLLFWLSSRMVCTAWLD